MWFKYDDKGRLTKETYTYKSYDTYEYGSSQVMVKQYSKTNELTGSGTFILNSKGYITGGFANYRHDEHTEKYEYDNNGILIKASRIGGYWSDKTTYKYENGNMVQQIIVNRYQNQRSIDTTTYTFFTDKTSTIENKNYGLSYQSNLHKNLKKTVDSKYQKGTFYYKFDDKERVAMQTLKNGIDTIYYLKYSYAD